MCCSAGCQKKDQYISPSYLFTTQAYSTIIGTGHLEAVSASLRNEHGSFFVRSLCVNGFRMIRMKHIRCPFS